MLLEWGFQRNEKAGEESEEQSAGGGRRGWESIISNGNEAPRGGRRTVPGQQG